MPLWVPEVGLRLRHSPMHVSMRGQQRPCGGPWGTSRCRPATHELRKLKGNQRCLRENPQKANGKAANMVKRTWLTACENGARQHLCSPRMLTQARGSKKKEKKKRKK